MTIPNPTDAPLLRTDADVLHRVQELVGPANSTRQLWIMFLDGDGRQAPVVVPVADVPPRPEAGMIRNLAAVLGGLCGDLATDAGEGAVILTLERAGHDAVLASDREWAGALAGACERAGARLRGLYLSTSTAVRPMAPP